MIITSVVAAGLINSIIGGQAAIAGSNIVSGWRNRVQNEKLHESSQQFTVKMETERQRFQEYTRGKVEMFQQGIETDRINAQFQLQTNQTEAQFELQKRSFLASMELERLRNNFSIEGFDRNKAMQFELADYGHRLRLAEQSSSFENTILLADYQRFLLNWPLIVAPHVAKDAYIASDNSLSLGVFLSTSNEPEFNKLVYPFIQQGLKEYVEIYHNILGVHNVVFFENAYQSTVYGSGMMQNIYYALKGLPTLIIGINVLPGEVCVDYLAWGLGNYDKVSNTFLKLPYISGKRNADKQIDLDYYRGIADKILVHLKFISGFTFDCYNFFEYNRAPLLPLAVKAEQGQPGIRETAKLKSEENLSSLVSKYYRDAYSTVFHLESQDPLSWLPNKNSDPAALRLNFAKSLRDSISGEEYAGYVKDALFSWVQLRTGEKPLGFLNSFCDDIGKIKRYCGEGDRDFLTGAYSELSYAVSGANTCEDTYTELINALGSITTSLQEICFHEPVYTQQVKTGRVNSIIPRDYNT